MARVRPLERGDLPAAARLMKAGLPGRTADEGFLGATLVDQPWADPELPSLVAEARDGEVVGFVGVQARRLRYGTRSLRGVCCSHLVVAPGGKAGPAGALLLAKLLAGPQDVTWSDSATEGVVRVWNACGGHADHTRSCDWMLVLRPARWLESIVRAAIRREPLGRAVLPVGALPFHAAGPRLARRAHPAPRSDVSSAPVAPEALVELLPGMLDGVLRVDYDVAYLEHLFAQVEATNGSLARRVVRRDGRPIGWYAYISRPRGVSRVLHVAAAPREIDAVVGDLVTQARGAGSAVLAGRLEPHLSDPIRRRFAAVGFARLPVIHARDPELDALLATGSSLLTQLDSEWYVT
jgi:hypothetical protein